MSNNTDIKPQSHYCNFGPSSSELANERVRQALDRTSRNLDGHKASTLHRCISTQVASHMCFSEVDPVLNVVRCDIQNLDVSENLWRQAYKTALDNFDAYLQVFGELFPADLRESVESGIADENYDSGANETLAHDWKVFSRRLSNQGSVSKFPTGISSVDRSLGDGLHGLTFLLGDKNVGKTWLLVNASLASLNSNPQTAVLFYSLDMSKTRMMCRLACLQLGIPSGELLSHSVSPEIQQRVTADVPHTLLSRMKIHERDFGLRRDKHTNACVPVGMTANAMTRDAIQLLHHAQAQNVLIVIDLFQKMMTPVDVPVSETDSYRLDLIGEVRARLGCFGNENKVAFLVASEMRKREGSRRNEPPTIDDLKGDGRLASDADAIITLWPTRTVDNDINDICLRIAKGRDGVVRGDHQLRFYHRFGRFEEVGSGEAHPTQQAQAAGDLVQDPFEE